VKPGVVLEWRSFYWGDLRVYGYLDVYYNSSFRQLYLQNILSTLDEIRAGAGKPVYGIILDTLDSNSPVDALGWFGPFHEASGSTIIPDYILRWNQSFFHETGHVMKVDFMDMTPDARVALYQWLAGKWAETTNIVARELHTRYPFLKVYVMTAGLYSSYAYTPLTALLKLDSKHIEGVISGGYAFFEDHVKRTLLDAYALSFWAHKAGLKAYFYHQLNRWSGTEFNNVSGAERVIRYTFRQVVAD
jgi:hypothetical protein